MLTVKKIYLIISFTLLSTFLFSQNIVSPKEQKETKRNEKKNKINDLIRQDEEGVLVYKKQSLLGVQFRTNGYGVFYEHGRMRSQRNATIYRLDFTEIKYPKEEKLPEGGFSFGNPYIYGKINNFYQFHLGFGRQHILGQKGNKNGVALSTQYSGGFLVGLLRPYYIDVLDNGTNKTIKFTTKDSALFVGGYILGGGGFNKGWNEIKFKPGAFLKTNLRFDFGRFNEVISALEVGVSGEFYSEKIPIMLFQKDKQFYIQGHIALLFGHRK